MKFTLPKLITKPSQFEAPPSMLSDDNVKFIRSFKAGCLVASFAFAATACTDTDTIGKVFESVLFICTSGLYFLLSYAQAQVPKRTTLISTPNFCMRFIKALNPLYKG